jgi:uncharacterized membrane protein YraQ (UPF0718 family)
MVALSGYLLYLDIERSSQGFVFTINALLDVLPMFIVATFLAGLIRSWIHQDLIIKYLGIRKGRNIPIAAALGIVTPGPVYSIYPLLNVLRDKGASSEAITTFLFGQTMIGPMRTALEVSFFSAPFFIFRIALAFTLAVLAGITSTAVFAAAPSLRITGEMKESVRDKILTSDSNS